MHRREKRVEVGAFLREEGGENVLAVEVTH
jgi:hypothetical protein